MELINYRLEALGKLGVDIYISEFLFPGMRTRGAGSRSRTRENPFQVSATTCAIVPRSRLASRWLRGGRPAGKQDERGEGWGLSMARSGPALKRVAVSTHSDSPTPPAQSTLAATYELYMTAWFSHPYVRLCYNWGFW